jgi:hypothetical protein
MRKEFMLLLERRSLYQIQNKFHFSRHEQGGKEEKGLQYAEYLPDNAQKKASAYASGKPLSCPSPFNVIQTRKTNAPTALGFGPESVKSMFGTRWIFYLIVRN